MNDQEPEPLTADQSGMQKEWAGIAAWAEHCDHCQVTARHRDVGNGRTVVEVAHEPGCPDTQEV